MKIRPTRAGFAVTLVSWLTSVAAAFGAQGLGEPFATLSISERLAHLGVPGVSIAVIDDGEIDWALGFGLADLEAGTPVTPETLFQAASISKPLAAVAALKLAEGGSVGLDEDLTDLLGGIDLGSRPVTLTGLLTHTAGLTHHDFPGYATGEPLPSLGQIIAGQKPAKTPPIRIDFPPGADFRYSNGGYLVLQRFLTHATDLSFPDLMREWVLSPIGMRRSTYEQPLPESWHAEAATGYRSDRTPVAGGWRIYPEMAAMGLWSTPSDLARFAIELQRSYRGQSDALLSEGMTRRMLAADAHGRGLGPAIEGKGKSLRFGHGGASEGFRCRLVAFLERGQGAVVMTNSDSGRVLIEEVLVAIAAAYQWPEL